MSAALLNHWDALKAQADRLLATPLAGLASGVDHVSRCMLTLDNLHFVFARQRIDQSALERLLALAGDAGVQERLQALMDGETVNTTAKQSTPPNRGPPCIPPCVSVAPPVRPPKKRVRRRWKCVCEWSC